MANVRLPMECEGEHPRLTRALICVFKVKPCPFDDCEGPAKCVFKHPGEQGRRDPNQIRYGPTLCRSYCRKGGSCPLGDTCLFAHGFLELWFHPQFFLGNDASKLTILEVNARMVGAVPPVLPCERAAVQLFHVLKSSGQICGYKHDDILLDRAARDAVYKYVHYLTTVGSIDGPNFLISGSSMLVVPEFPGSTSTVGSRMPPVVPEFAGISTVWSRVPPLVMPEFAGTSTVGSRMPLVCAVDAWSMVGGGSAQTDPDHVMLVEPDDLKLDSGASNHVVCEKTLLQGYESLVGSCYMEVADGYPLEVVGTGDIITKEFFIPNVYRVKGLKKNLISVSQLVRDHGLFVGFHGEICEVLKRDGEKVGGGFVQANGIYKLSFLEVPEAEAAYEGA